MRAGAGRRTDRRVASSAFGAAVVVFAVALAVAHTPAPRLPQNDPKAAHSVVALLVAGENTSYVVAYNFTRTRSDGAKFSTQSFEARTPNVLVTRLGDTLTAVGAGTSFDCGRSNGKASCHQRVAGKYLPQSEVVHIAIGAAPYDVWRIADAVIGGERARCYALRSATGGQIPELGLAAELCFDSQGVTLRRRVFTDVIDDWEATAVAHRFDNTTLQPLLVGFEAASPKLGN